MTKKNATPKPRNHHAVAARSRSGAGKHDARPKRQRTRGTIKRAVIAAALATLALGCGTSVTVEPVCNDAGPVVIDDASADGGIAPTPGTITSVQACRLLENTQLAHEALRSCTQPACPWPGLAGPGLPSFECDAARVIECVEAVDRSNVCGALDEAIIDCDPDACWEVE